MDPRRGKQYEVGLKYQPEGTSDLYTLALYDLTNSNLTVSDPGNPGFQLQEGEAGSRGIELAMRRAIGGFRVDASATLQRIENEGGAEIATVPDAFASVWDTWAPSAGALEGLRAGLGLRHTGEKWDGTDTQRTPSNTLFDARIAYQWDRYEAALNVTNSRTSAT